jgi:DNA transformation protein
MKKSDSFHDFVVNERLSGVEGIRSRKMFGGYGIYRGPAFFAIIFDGRLYFKAGPALAQNFKKRGSEPFVYEKRQGTKKKKVTMSYWSVPEDVLEDREEFLRWAEQSLASITKTG